MGLHVKISPRAEDSSPRPARAVSLPQKVAAVSVAVCIFGGLFAWVGWMIGHSSTTPSSVAEAPANTPFNEPGIRALPPGLDAAAPLPPDNARARALPDARIGPAGRSLPKSDVAHPEAPLVHPAGRALPPRLPPISTGVPRAPAIPNNASRSIRSLPATAATPAPDVRATAPLDIPLALPPPTGTSKDAALEPLRRADKEASARMAFADKLRFVMSLCADPQGNIWIGTEDHGVFRYNPDAPEGQQYTQFTTKDGLGDDNGYAVACDHRGRIWAGHLNHGVSVYNGQKWQNYEVVGGLSRPESLSGPLGERVFAISVCPTDGDVWIATNCGLSRYSQSKDSWSYYTRTEGLPSDQANSLAFSADGILYVGTQSDGIALADASSGYKVWRSVRGPEQLPTRPSGEGLPTCLINQVVVRKDGTVYAATTAGLAWSKDAGQTWQYVRGLDYAEKVRGLAGGPPSDWREVPGAVLAEDYCTCLATGESGSLWVGHRQRGYEIISTVDPLRSDPGTHGRFVSAIVRLPSSTFVAAYGEGCFTLTSGISPAAPSSDPAVTAPEPRRVKPTIDPAFPATAAPLSEFDLRTLLAVMEHGEPTSHDGPSAEHVGQDWTTRGTWTGAYGGEFAVCAAMAAPYDHVSGQLASSFDYSVRLGPGHTPGDSLRYWVHWAQTEQERCLENVFNGGRRQSEWDDHKELLPRSHDGPGIVLAVQVPKGDWRMSLYFVNKDGHSGDDALRDYALIVKPGNLSDEQFAPATSLARARVMQFWGGMYQSFRVRGGQSYTLRIDANWSFNTICSGLFFDALKLPPGKARPAGARYVQFRRDDGRSELIEFQDGAGSARIEASVSASEAELKRFQDARLKSPALAARWSRRVYAMLATELQPALRDRTETPADAVRQIQLRQKLAACYRGLGLRAAESRMHEQEQAIWLTGHPVFKPTGIMP